MKALVTGGAGYVGAVLVPKLLAKGYSVKVLDLYLYGEGVFETVQGHPNLEQIKADIRDVSVLKRTLPGCDAVIHLACISNDPSFDLNPELGKSINYDAFIHLVDIAKDAGIKRFIYASSSSVYGIKEEENVTEELELKPLTDYSKYKAMCEDVLLKKRSKGFVTLIVRPATVCGYSPRLRLDLTVNILTNHAFNRRVITVFGGSQMRPNIHIEDIADLYLQSLQWPDEKIDGKIYNVGYQNLRVFDIAERVRNIVGEDVTIVIAKTDDNRSYHISSEKIREELGFQAYHTIEEAVQDLVTSFQQKKISSATDDDRYYNIRMIKKLELQ
ncbi:MAG: UDP-glucose 4-epimerase [Deltaproteobacteria bacterium RIFCSPLOWO2_01_44_7]|nr:MAG: UDP-glucose 4-epimerase [Deltaproteobacteria bacterium RIFCSPHIGHO2_01_FULL_43_49]OGQ15059.1 MAG: UDP-glucose 4-epimerase [Deltaproteobacteria bacterium RIFCSPHIGHO2_02_FULL_44_53]OGQ27321.1 MAG: UDP-glucose 4-epimerase [Deltaproteobacteria bacterium RIFCSPHIGHO2_12_FULL_44_21]OGQ31576.1 MAG: UDP-glucose 4-epimerase [Deltaproteobacteria bacterium RIFCSPLOWO2_01_FULL_45_74]OGQ42612.1 MAG: UDP-glucose 4-epimerase [Deltaproteobacteria bacterium RIFCSPLOWO2_01_44_7]OGQ42777.1 MAG: UDP-gluc